MPGWQSQVDICNGALALLGAEGISSLADGTPNATMCGRFYGQVLDTTLTAFPWNFATRRANLGATLASNDANAPVWGFTYGFALPTNPYCLRVLESEDHAEYRVEGRYLYAKQSTMRIRYIARIEDPATFSALFADTLAAALAVRLAMPITKSGNIFDKMGALYANLLNDAYDIDSQEGTADVIDSDTLLDVRRTTGGRY